MQDTVHSIVREAETNYLNGTVQISEHVDWSMHDTIERIDAYLNSRHTTGPTDALGRDKPFFNIVTAATNIWYRATDIDRKNIRILPDNSSNTAIAFIATVLLQEWMKKSRFGVFLNDWGRALARYGSAVVKFVERDGELIASVIPWNRLIVDPIDFDAIPRIEKLYLTPSQLRKNKFYNKESVEGLIKSSQQGRKDLDGNKVDNMSGFIELYEVHGEMSVAVYKRAKGIDKITEEDETTYRQQMHVIAYTGSERDGFENFTLFCGYEAKDPYMITHLIKEDGRTLSIGSVEYLFDSQWMLNHSMKNMKDTLDLASKLIFQTSDANFVGRNVLNEIETGDIFIHKENMPITRIANDKPDISAFQSYGVMWQNLGGEITSTPDAIRGNTLPSGTPYSLAAYQGAQANSLFEIMTENKGLHIEDMLREFVLPHLMTKMDSSDEVVAVLDANQIAEVDAMYVPRKAIEQYNSRVIDQVLTTPPEQIMEGNFPSPYDPQQEEAAVKESMAQLGNKRAFKPSEIVGKKWKDALDGFVMNAVVEVTNENTDKQAVLTTLSSVLQTIAGNPMILQDPNAKMIFSAILQETGRISPIQLSTAQAQRQPQPMSSTGGAGALQELTKPNVTTGS